MSPSPLVQASQESIESLHSVAGLWSQVFHTTGAARTQLETQADAIAAVFQALSIAYGALPRYRTEPALRRFMEAMQQLERALRDAGSGPLAEPARPAAAAAAQGARHAEAAFATLSGKPAESPESARLVRGAVQRLLSDRGYGFLRPTGSTAEVFFSAQNVRGARFGALRVGQTVSFRILPDPRVPGRMHAVDVQPIP